MATVIHDRARIPALFARSSRGTGLIVSMVLLNLNCMSESNRLVPNVEMPEASGAGERIAALDRLSDSADPTTRARSEVPRVEKNEPEKAATPAVVELEGPRSEPLSCGLFNPMPGGVTAGYMADTGLDLAGSPRDVFAIASGTLNYAEAGHTLWNSKRDSPYAIRLELDHPIQDSGHKITHVWYAHLSEVAHELHEGSEEVVHVRAGQRLGRSGSANGSPHLHLGLLLDGKVNQAWGTFLLEDDVRHVLCGWGKGKRLPSLENEPRPSVASGSGTRRER